MNYYGYDITTESSLSHYGVPGMKWGVRRYQDASGGLTKAGTRRYKGTNYIKGLNRLDKDISKTITARARNKVRMEKALNSGNIEKAKRYKSADKDFAKAIDNGRNLTSSILKEARKNNVSIGRMEKTRYTDKGRMWAAAFVGGIPGALVSGGVSLHQAKLYGDEAGGFVRGNEYYRGR